MRKICALFCSLGVLTSVSNRYSKSCEKCSQNLISYERAYREGNSFVRIVSRLSWGIFKICAGTFGFLSNDVAELSKLLTKEGQEKRFLNWLKIGFVLVGIDGFRDLMDASCLDEERANFELLKEVYDKNFKGKSNIILSHFKENDISVTYNAIRLLESLIEFRAYWETYCNSTRQNILEILTPNTDLSKLKDEKVITAANITEILDKSESLPGSDEIKKTVDCIIKILDKISLNISCVEKLEHDLVNVQMRFNFDDARSKFVEIQKSQRSLYEEANKNLTDLYNFMQKSPGKC